MAPVRHRPVHAVTVVVVMHLLGGRVTSALVDETLMPNRNGSSVVRAVIEKIDASKIFEYSGWWQSANKKALVKIFLRRMAYVETRDGKSYSVGGIWNVAEEMFNQTKSPSVAYSDHYRSILQKMRSSILNMDWRNITYANMTVPIYSGLAVALYLDKLIFMHGSGFLPTNPGRLNNLWRDHFDGVSRTVSWDDAVQELIRNERTY